MNIETMKRIITASKTSCKSTYPNTDGVYVQVVADGIVRIMASNGCTALRILVDDKSIKSNMFFRSSDINYLKGIVKNATTDGIRTIPLDHYIGVDSVNDVSFPYYSIERCISLTYEESTTIELNVSMLHDLMKSMQYKNKSAVVKMTIPKDSKSLILIESRSSQVKGVIAQIV